VEYGKSVFVFGVLEERPWLFNADVLWLGKILMRKALWVRIFVWICNREEKSLRHVVMVAKFLDERYLKSEFALFQTLFLIKFHLICGNVGKILEGWIRKDQFLCYVHLLHKWAREIRNRATKAKKVQKSVMHVRSFCFANTVHTYCFCTVLVAVAVVVAEAPYCCDPEILLPW